MVRKRWFFAFVALLALIALCMIWRTTRPMTGMTLSQNAGTRQPSAVNPEVAPAAAEEDTLAQLPLVLGPEATPTATATLAPTPTATSTGTPNPNPTVLPGNNALANGGFEEGWTDLPPAPGFLINQQPNSWTLDWLDPGQPLYDDPGTLSQGVPECLHKLANQLPPNEQPGSPNALVLDGTATYKMFHHGAPFGSELRQVVTLPPGTSWRLIVPIQTHLHGDLDAFGAESGVWVLLSENEALGGWANGGVMGDRRWFDHAVEFDVPVGGQVIVLLRVKSKWFAPKDFFMDALRLEPATNPRGEVAPGHARIFWGAADYPDQVDYWSWLSPLSPNGMMPALPGAATPTPVAYPANE
jgi:hypothetical protein